MNGREPYCLFLKLISLALNILRLNCYRCSVLDGGVDFFDFVVRDGDAAGCPVFPPVPEFKEESGDLVRVAVDHNVAGLDLRSDWILAQRNSVRLDNTIAVAQVHLALRLFYENVVDGRGEHGFSESYPP